MDASAAPIEPEDARTEEALSGEAPAPDVPTGLPPAGHAAPVPRWAWLVPLVLAALAWGGAIERAGFSYDDREVLTDNPVVDGRLPAWRALDRDYWHHREDAGHWRPAATLTLRLDHARAANEEGGSGGLRPGPFHVTNLVLHLVVVFLAALVLARIGAGRAGLLGLALFAAHPALADSVAWISGRTSMLSAIGGLFGMVLVVSVVRAATWIAIATTTGLLIGLAGKEDALVFAVLLPLVASRAGARAFVASGIGAAVAVGVWLVARQVALGEALPSAPGAPLAHAPLDERLGVGGRAMVEATRLVAFPVDHPPGYRADAFDATGPAAAIRGWLGWALWAALALFGALRWLTGPRWLGLSALAVALAWLPMAQLVPSGEVLAPRFLYLPLLLGAPLLGAVLARLPLALVAGGLAACIPLAWSRAEVYADRASYWEARLAREVHRPETWNALGNARLEAGDPASARAAWLRGTEIDPDYSRNWVGLGRLALQDGDDDAAEDHFRRAVEVGPRNPVAHHNLGAFYVNRGRAYEAVPLLEQAVRLAPGAAHSWRTLARAHESAGSEARGLGSPGDADAHAQRSLDVWRRVLELDPGDADAARALRTP